MAYISNVSKGSNNGLPKILHFSKFQSLLFCCCVARRLGVPAPSSSSWSSRRRVPQRTQKIHEKTRDFRETGILSFVRSPRSRLRNISSNNNKKFEWWSYDTIIIIVIITTPWKKPFFYCPSSSCERRRLVPPPTFWLVLTCWALDNMVIEHDNTIARSWECGQRKLQASTTPPAKRRTIPWTSVVGPIFRVRTSNQITIMETRELCGTAVKWNSSHLVRSCFSPILHFLRCIIPSLRENLHRITNMFSYDVVKLHYIYGRSPERVVLHTVVIIGGTPITFISDLLFFFFRRKIQSGRVLGL